MSSSAGPRIASRGARREPTGARSNASLRSARTGSSGVASGRDSPLEESRMRRVTWLARHWYRKLDEGFDRWAGALARARRAARCANTGEGWLSEEERKLLDALSSTILPSDNGAPGAREAGVVDTLDRRLAGSP